MGRSTTRGLRERESLGTDRVSVFIHRYIVYTQPSSHPCVYRISYIYIGCKWEREFRSLLDASHLCVYIYIYNVVRVTSVATLYPVICLFAASEYTGVDNFIVAQLFAQRRRPSQPSRPSISHAFLVSLGCCCCCCWYYFTPFFLFDRSTDNSDFFFLQGVSMGYWWSSTEYRYIINWENKFAPLLFHNIYNIFSKRICLFQHSHTAPRERYSSSPYLYIQHGQFLEA